MKLRVFPSAGELFQAAAGEFARRAEQAVKARGRFCVALSGGSTPKGLFGLLSSKDYASLPWSKTFLFWGDERQVPPDHPDSNYRMTRENLLSRVRVADENVFRMHGELDAEQAAAEYEQTLKSFFQLKPGEFPRFDLTLNGMGADGHTASLFPGSSAAEERARLVAGTWVEKLKSFRISLTFPVFDHAACVLFLVAGKDKAPALRSVLEHPGSGLPAQGIRPAGGELLWFVDQAAASALQQTA